MHKKHFSYFTKSIFVNQEGGGGHWTENYNGTQRFIKRPFRNLENLFFSLKALCTLN